MAEELNGWQKFWRWLRGDNLAKVLTGSPEAGFVNITEQVGSVENLLGSLINTYTGAELTGAQKAMNQYNTLEAQKARDFAERMSNTSYQRGVADMKVAGVNPGLMYGAGASGASTPSGAQASGSVGSAHGIQELFTMMTLPYQLRQMEANTRKTIEETTSEKIRQQEMAQTVENLKATYNEILSRTDLNDTQQANLVVVGSWLDRIQEAQYNESLARTKVDKVTAKRLEKLLSGELQIQAKSIEDFDRQWQKLDKEIEKLADESNLLKRDLEDYAINHMVSGVAGTGANVINILRAYLEDQADKDKDGKRDD